MNIHQIHSNLAKAVRRRAMVQQYLTGDCSLAGRFVARLCQAYVQSHISKLTYQLRAN